MAVTSCISCRKEVDMTFNGQCRRCVIDDFDAGDNEGLCDCHGEPFEMCPDNFDCGMMPDGTCSLAGSEDCDWECPRNRA